MTEHLIKLSPAYKGYIWGGTRLIDEYGMDCGLDRLAEAWVASAHPDGESMVISGKDEGISFVSFLKKYYPDITSGALCDSDKYPLLVKFLDARSDLSVQVHPDDAYGLKNEGQCGKSEMWLILDSDEGAGIYVGFKEDMDREQVIKAVEDGTVLDKMNFYTTKKGEVYFIPAGTVHAIGAGNLICEVQNSSSCTYRLFDYDRVDKNGNKRELHLDKALDVMNYNRYDALVEEDDGDMILDRDMFKCYRYRVSSVREVELEKDMSHLLICVVGKAKVKTGDEELELKAGESCFVAPGTSSVILEGNASIVRARR
ncbi:MAG TPA: mannose-6-phosphate isomerase [Clostridiales bacterium]|nr:mannose-6-phosphate isomerase [Clostridiales bacterium]